MRQLTTLTLLGVLLLGTGNATGGDKGENNGLLTLIDEAGNEIQLRNWKMVQGVKVPPWLTRPAGKPDPKAKKPAPAEGPEYLELREAKLPMYKEDMTTWIPLASVKQMDYQHGDKRVTVTALDQAGKEHLYRCPTDYLFINKFHVDGEVEKANLSPGSKLALRDGQILIKAIRFPMPKPGPEAKGRAATVTVKDKAKTKHAVVDLLPLYSTRSGAKLDPILMFQKTIKVDIKKLEKLVNLPGKTKGVSYDFEVYQTGAEKQGLTLLTQPLLDGKEAATLVGLLGKVSGGFKLFPASIIQEVTLEKMEDTKE